MARVRDGRRCSSSEAIYVGNNRRAIEGPIGYTGTRLVGSSAQRSHLLESATDVAK